MHPNRAKAMAASMIAPLLLLTAACSSSTQSPASADGASPTNVASKGSTSSLTIGLVLGNTSEFYATMQKGAEAEASKLGLKLVVAAPTKWDAVQQSGLIDAMTAKKVDALIAVPNDSQASISPLQRAYQAGIPVVTADTSIGDGNYTSGSVKFPAAWVTTDNFSGGQQTCEQIIHSMGGHGKLFIEDVQAGIATNGDRYNGCVKAINATNGAVKLAGHGFCNEDASKAAQDVAAALQRDPNINGFFGDDTFAAKGGVQAIHQAHLDDKITSAWFDSDKAGASALQSGQVTLLVAQQVAKMGMIAVDDAVAAAQGKSVKKLETLPPSILTKATLGNPESASLIYGS